MSAPPPGRAFGKTGLTVPALGFGAGIAGDPSLSERQAEALLHSVLDLGISLVDSARSYGASEERIGRYLAHRRGEFVLSTKVGYGVPGHEDWTAGCVSAGVDLALANLRTDVLDLVHLHSCPRSTLEGSGVVEALVRAVAAGKVRVAAYSGDNEALDWAIASGAFGSVQFSLNLVDQGSVETALPAARERGLGIIAKRALANAVWRRAPAATEDPTIAMYRERWNALALDLGDLPVEEVALRFAANLPGVHTVLVGSGRLEHLKQNVAAISRGPLPEGLERAIRLRFRERGAPWPGVV
ncbi:MAG TPA: aldo/keto reductase [Thermoanaerobaculia bacterium]|nr:aldo/keto reductase [Thermoanaerobaculia bacterium]